MKTEMIIDSYIIAKNDDGAYCSFDCEVHLLRKCVLSLWLK